MAYARADADEPSPKVTATWAKSAAKNSPTSLQKPRPCDPPAQDARRDRLSPPRVMAVDASRARN
ncbi:hypothetical protein BE221DRAFT_79141 [Ostreococcus tauri]|uniref:Uncharacterized protein n=1 Tax=Ostreococcus tauri TaxID=70448 RepID=A0A1Y5I7W0_OSTTA|nr:hypothetical protein BE221DRAFT_79141 [Ostreococcus tauri]